MTQQTLDDWLAAGNRITVCPSVPHLSFVRILSILDEDVPTPQPERLCRRCGAPLTGRTRQIYCDSRCFLSRGRVPKPARTSRWRRLKFGN